LHKIPHAGVHRRAELLDPQLDGLQALRRTLRPELLAESRKHKAAKLLRPIPCIGPIRAARLLALMPTPHRFRSKRQLWTYRGLGIETHDRAQYRYVRGQLQGSKKPQQIRGLNQNQTLRGKRSSREPLPGTAVGWARCATSMWPCSIKG
jgi:transposase